jgi:hypothetical protein
MKKKKGLVEFRDGERNRDSNGRISRQRKVTAKGVLDLMSKNYKLLFNELAYKG